MRSQLGDWEQQVEPNQESLHPVDSIIASTLYHTLSIYLHTMFTASPKWRELKIIVPTLERQTISGHVTALTRIIKDALKNSLICPIVFLLPLYVAANAVDTVDGRIQVRDMLYQIRDRYCVVINKGEQVLPFWTPNDAFQGQDAGNDLLKDRRLSVLRQLGISQNQHRDA